MLKELKFVQGAVSKKNFLPALTHFKIQNGTVRSYNGMLALCSPIQLDIDCMPKAEPFIKAISHCDDTVNLTVTPTGRLSVKSGAFRALIDCVTDQDTPHALPEGNEFSFNGEHLLQAFKTIIDFVGDDASRPWTNGILLSGQSAFATNNVCLIEYWIGSSFPFVCNIPKSAIREMVRIDEPPCGGQYTDTSITFHYSDGRWIRTQLFSTEWPDLGKILNTESNLLPIDSRIFEGLEKLGPFTDKMGRIFVKDGYLATSSQREDGAEFFIPDMQYDGIYNIEMLQLLQNVVKQIDFSRYPKPCLFQGDRLRGAIIGMRPEMSWEEYNKSKQEQENGES